MRISREALWRNAVAVTQYVGVPVIGVVKCDGYGVSILEAALAWQRAGVTCFAVSTPEEALSLRKAGFCEDILLLSPVADPALLHILLEHKVILIVTGLSNAEFYLHNTQRRPLRVHVAIDTGMGRFGVRWSDLAQIEAVYALSGFQFEGVFSHCAKSFEATFHRTKKQLQRFLAVTNYLTTAGIPVGIRHFANSCAALRFPETRLDAVRVGSALVGKLCAKVPIRLQQATEFRAQVVDQKTLFPGDTTGYGCACRVMRRRNVVVVALGYEDGFGYCKGPVDFGLRGMAVYCLRVALHRLHRPYVVYQGRKLPLIGRVGQQYTLFDATGVNICPGDYVTACVSQLFPRQNRIVTNFD